ncbi:MAG: response regulator [Parvularculaceae bacterium]
MAERLETADGMENPARILIIDDDPIMRELASAKLAEAGYVAIVAENGRAGLDEIRETPCDLVITDLDMPEMGGYEFTETLRADAALAAIPIIVITGSDSSEAVERAFAVGATSFLAKPMNWALLGNSVKFVLQAARDQAALSAARDRAEAGERFKDALMSLMSHELRTPLNAIIGFGQMLSAHFDDVADPSNKEYADYVVDGGKRLLNSVSDMLLASDSRAGPIALNEADSALRDVVEPAVDLAAKEAGLARIAIKVAIHDDDLEIRCDRQLMTRALWKLVDNAVMLSPHGTTVTVATGRPKGGGVAFLVRDEGPGVPPDRLDGLIQPFTQLNMSLSRSTEGLGLGLPLAQAIARAHGGALKLASTAGEGLSAFIVTPPERVLAPRRSSAA